MPVTEAKRDYYEVLGVDRSATRDDIKHAYRQKALLYHPDKNKDPGAAAQFRELAEAYAVLSDEAKRKEYDTTGHAGVSERWSQDDLMRDFQFGDFFGGRFGDLSGIFSEFFGRRMRPEAGATKGVDLRYDLDLTLEEAARGGERDLQITRSEKCVPCGGTGAKAGTQSLSCAECKGTGQKQEVKSKKDVRLVTLSTCTRCQGRGHVIESPCPLCQGRGYQFIPHALKVRIPPGIDDGMVIRLAGQGEANVNGGPSGDLLIRAHIRPNPAFERHGDDLYTVQTVSFPDAALGKKLRVRGLGGEMFHVAVPAGTQSGTALRLNGKGMPKVRGKGKGDLFVVVEVRTPTNFTERERGLLEELARLQSS
jgi:molecular chaperone DnaJ